MPLHHLEESQLWGHLGLDGDLAHFQSHNGRPWQSLSAIYKPKPGETEKLGRQTGLGARVSHTASIWRLCRKTSVLA